MKTIDLFPTVTELIRSVIRATVAVIPEDRRRLDVVPIDPATIGRATTCRAIVQQVIAHYATMDDDGMIATSLSLAIDRFTNNQNAARVVQLRHPEVWFLYPIEIVHAQLNAMVYRNEQINGTVTPQAFVDWLVTSGGQAHRVNDLHKKSAIRDAMVGVWSIDHESRTPLADILQNLADDYYITLTNSDKHELERKHTLETICEYLTAKLHERKPNDGMVQYGTTYGGSRQEQERQDFEDRWGGSICVPAGLPMKHVSDLFNALGTSMGIMDEVPVEDRVGPLKNAQAPIRIWVRTAPAEVAQGTFGLGAAVKERQYYQAHPESPHMDYLDHDAMLDDGWVVD